MDRFKKTLFLVPVSTEQVFLLPFGASTSNQTAIFTIMDFVFQTENKHEVFKEVKAYLDQHNIQVESVDTDRPWGGFFVIDTLSLSRFLAHFFPDLHPVHISGDLVLSPKILLVEPGKRLSWQYHYRRSEVWTVIGGSAGVIISDTDKQTSMKRYTPGQTINIKKEQRHRLVGLDEWGMIAEIWQHSDPRDPSNEDDIVRLEDDFGR